MNEIKNNNQLPKDWKWVKLGEVCKTTSGGTPSRREPKFYNGNIPWVKSGELDKGVITDTEEKISEEAIKNSSAKIFPKGTLLIALYGATIGKLAFLGVDAATNQAICGIYQNEKINSHFLYNYLFHKKQKLVNQGIGGAQPNISQTILKDLDLPLPPITTQLAIVSKIEELFSELDKGIEQLKTAQQQLKTYRQSVLKWAFEGKLTNDLINDSTDLNDDYDLPIAAEDKPEYKTKKNQGIQNNQINHGSDKGRLPVGWKRVELGEVIAKLDQGWSPKCLNESSKNNDEWAVIKTSAVQHGYFLSNENKVLPKKLKPREQHELRVGDILITRAGPRIRVGVCCMVKFTRPKLINCDKVYRIKVDNKLVIPEYVELLLNSPIYQAEIEKMKSGISDSGLNLTQKMFLQMKIPFTSIEEQQNIVQEIESRLSVADKMEESISQSLQQAEALRQSILKKAFEGRLVLNYI